MHTQAFHSQTLDHVIVDGILRVLIDQATGEPVAVRAIRAARDAAQRAWASTADLF